MSYIEAIVLVLSAAAVAGLLIAPDVWKHFTQRIEMPPPPLTFEERLLQEPSAAAFLAPLVASLDEPYKTSLKHAAAYRCDVPMPTSREELLIATRNAASWTGIAEDKGGITQSGPKSSASLYRLVEYLQRVEDVA